jgi:hypothetical protein
MFTRTRNYRVNGVRCGDTVQQWRPEDGIINPETRSQWMLETNCWTLLCIDGCNIIFNRLRAACLLSHPPPFLAFKLNLIISVSTSHSHALLLPVYCPLCTLWPLPEPVSNSALLCAVVTLEVGPTDADRSQWLFGHSAAGRTFTHLTYCTSNGQ